MEVELFSLKPNLSWRKRARMARKRKGGLIRYLQNNYYSKGRIRRHVENGLTSHAIIGKSLTELIPNNKEDGNWKQT